jgi:hypothetical protein
LPIFIGENVMTDNIQIAEAVPFYRRLWFVVLLTFLLFPVSLIILVTGNVYRRKDGTRHPIGKGFRYAYAGFLALWLGAIVLSVFAGSKSPGQHWAGSANPDVAASNSSAPNSSDTSAPVQAPAAEDSPNMKVTVEPTEHAPLAKVIGDDDAAFTIQRVVINGRENEESCDLPKFTVSGSMQGTYGTGLPVTLKRGDVAQFFSQCGDVLSIDVYTDRGHAQYKFDSNGNQ